MTESEINDGSSSSRNHQGLSSCKGDLEKGSDPVDSVQILLLEEREDLPLPDEIRATNHSTTLNPCNQSSEHLIPQIGDEIDGGRKIVWNCKENDIFAKLGYRSSDVWKEAWKLVKMALPIVAAYVLQFSLNITILVVIGPLGRKYTAAAALGTMFCNVTGMSLGMGMATAMDTLCSQAVTVKLNDNEKDDYNDNEEDVATLISARETVKKGKKKGNPLVGIILQRGIMIQILLSLPIFLLWSFSERLLVFLGQDPELSALASLLIKLTMPGLIPFMIFECLKKYLQAQGYMSSTLFVLAIASPINVFLTYALVYPAGLGFIGAPIATSITYFLLPCLTILYMIIFGGLECWNGWKIDSLFHGWYDFLRLGFAGIVMMCSEWWAFEVCALVAGLLGETALAAQTIVLQTSSLFYMVPLGLSISASNRVGNWLGGNFPGRARLSSHCSVIIAWLFAGVNATILMSMRFVWGYLFTQDPDVLALVSVTLPLAAIFQFADGTAGVCNGILRGCGRQRVGAWINLSGYYLLGLPLGIPLALCYRETLGIFGIWIGLCVALCLVGIVQLMVLSKTDWKLQVQIGHQLLKNSE